MMQPEVDWPRTFWWGVGAVLLAAVTVVLYAFVGTFVFALFIYYATRPAYHRIRRRLGSRSLSAALALLVFAVPAVTLLAYTLAIAIQELSALEGVDLGPYIGLVEPYVNISRAVEDPASLLANRAGLDAIQSTLESGVTYLGIVGNGLLHLFVMFAVAFYLLRDGGRLARWVGRFGDDRGVLDSYLRAVDRSLADVFFGNILNAIVTGAIGAIAFSALNAFAPAGTAIPYPAVTGLLTGVGSLIPVVGMKIVYVPMVGYLGFRATLQGTGYGFVLVVFLIALVVVDLLPDFVLRPYVSGRDLHVGLVMFAYILGPLLFGWYGIFLGPLVLVLVFHFARIVAPELLGGRTVRPTAVDPGVLSDGTVTGRSASGGSTAADAAEGPIAGTSAETDGGATDGVDDGDGPDDPVSEERA